jgi:hypothetical protein
VLGNAIADACARRGNFAALVAEVSIGVTSTAIAAATAVMLTFVDIDTSPR